MNRFLKQLFAFTLIHGAWTVTAFAQQAGDNDRNQEAPSFDLMVLQVDGNTVLDQQVIEKTVYPFLGPNKSIDDVEKARQALEDIYREQGYPTALVEIPEQDVVDGLVRLQVVEGSIERLIISGSRYYSLGRIREQVPALAKGQVPYMPDVQAQVGALGEQSGDRKITPIFRAGKTPGKTEVELRVDDELPLHGSIEVNANNPESTTRTRVIGSIRYDNLWQRFHSASLQYQVSPENPDEVDVWSGTYVLPTNIFDTRLALYGVGISSNTQLSGSVGALSVVGTGSIFGARLIKPLETVESYNHSLTLGFDYKSFDQGISVVGQDLESTPITYAPFQIGYDGTWRGDGSITTLSSAINFSIRGLGNDQQEFEDRRFKAQSNYTYLTGTLRHLHELPWDFRFSGRMAGQKADSPLISNEQFSAGGQQSVRGYHQTQQLGDDGLNFSIELQTPILKQQDWDFVQNLRAHVFFDYAYLWIQSPLPLNPTHYKLAGAGAGFRMQLFKHLSGEFDWAYPFYEQSTVDVGNQRIDFRVAYEF
ncbi:MAG: peptidase S9 [Gammaproteobacteria bacterium HGW-Gammaproteobacteria-10]|nr:MAG: peptidase S9 [Gammaproteobacteria bacterium HGW-Gammaproteobacteria-10]